MGGPDLIVEAVALEELGFVRSMDLGDRRYGGEKADEGVYKHCEFLVLWWEGRGEGGGYCIPGREVRGFVLDCARYALLLLWRAGHAVSATLLTYLQILLLFYLGDRTTPWRFLESWSSRVTFQSVAGPPLKHSASQAPHCSAICAWLDGDTYRSESR